ncbi:hypothetical protein KR75_10950 [Klebsiella variicola]|nr:hypothetical protein KR75_10950 [Klebsiella variicola]
MAKQLKTSEFEKQNLILGLLAIILSQTHHYSTTAFFTVKYAILIKKLAREPYSAFEPHIAASAYE